MLEQVYELNLPPFSEIIREDFTGFPKEKNNEYVTGFEKDLVKIIKPEWLTFLGLEWSSYRYFRKSTVIGSLHTDINLDHDDLYNRHKICVWGINWIFGGSGKIEFWNFENVKRTGVTIGSDNLPTFGIVPKYIPLKMSDYAYETLENKVYLINASLPHKAIGGKDRSAFSLRPQYPNLKKVGTQWDEIVEKFKDYII